MLSFLNLLVRMMSVRLSHLSTLSTLKCRDEAIGLFVDMRMSSLSKLSTTTTFFSIQSDLLRQRFMVRTRVYVDGGKKYMHHYAYKSSSLLYLSLWTPPSPRIPLLKWWPMVTVALLAELSFVIAVDRPWFEVRSSFQAIDHISSTRKDESLCPLFSRFCFIQKRQYWFLGPPFIRSCCFWPKLASRIHGWDPWIKKTYHWQW
jgi:hypothetical protein